ncbi:MAG: hypothetical protein ACJAW3_001364 [Lentimonas sp.]|jgi:hypothetical protein
MINKFKKEVSEVLGVYVYCLVDPRNKKVFYVGKGSNNRAFQHEVATEKLIREENREAFKAMDEKDKKSFLEEKKIEEREKCKIIKEIKDSEQEVGYVIHRHIPFYTDKEEYGKVDKKTANKIAFEIEASLIDVYGLENLTNSQAGHGSSTRGSQLAEDLNDNLSREPITEFSEEIMAICINKSYKNKENIYDSVREAWTCSLESAEKCEFVLAERFGVCVGVFKPTRWYTHKDETNRKAFEGEEVKNSKYLKKKLPERSRGESMPFRYFPKKLKNK